MSGVGIDVFQVDRREKGALAVIAVECLVNGVSI